MSKDFAIKIIASMVDESGKCGERGLSVKQFNIIRDNMDVISKDEHDAGQWDGDYATINFWSVDYVGNVGPYRVAINQHKHFNLGCNIISIELRPEGEYEAEQEEERRLRELRDFSGSEFVAEPKARVEFDLTLVDVFEFSGTSYSYYDDGTTYLYKFNDGNGNCVVWKTKKFMYEWHDAESDMWEMVEVKARATVKEHSEYRGIRQTVVNRPVFKATAA